ncbi:hypothetical protein B0H13DRAFT_1905370 [Mycena leptocephala]|nr:hypothetical protein B0H13DRAFT_1905370 [Mycena leptocephala]
MACEASWRCRWAVLGSKVPPGYKRDAQGKLARKQGSRSQNQPMQRRMAVPDGSRRREVIPRVGVRLESRSSSQSSTSHPGRSTSRRAIQLGCIGQPSPEHILTRDIGIENEIGEWDPETLARFYDDKKRTRRQGAGEGVAMLPSLARDVCPVRQSHNPQQIHGALAIQIFETRQGSEELTTSSVLRTLYGNFSRFFASLA